MRMALTVVISMTKGSVADVDGSDESGDSYDVYRLLIFTTTMATVTLMFMFCQQVLVEDLGPDVPMRFLRAVFRTGALSKIDFGRYTCYAADADSFQTASVDLTETSRCYACSSRNLIACVFAPLAMFVCNVNASQNATRVERRQVRLQYESVCRMFFKYDKMTLGVKIF